MRDKQTLNTYNVLQLICLKSVSGRLCTRVLCVYLCALRFPGRRHKDRNPLGFTHIPAPGQPARRSTPPSSICGSLYFTRIFNVLSSRLPRVFAVLSGCHFVAFLRRSRCYPAFILFVGPGTESIEQWNRQRCEQWCWNVWLWIMAAEIDTVSKLRLAGLWQFRRFAAYAHIAYTQRCAVRLLTVILQTTRLGSSGVSGISGIRESSKAPNTEPTVYFGLRSPCPPKKLAGHKVAQSWPPTKTDALTAVRVFRSVWCGLEKLQRANSKLAKAVTLAPFSTLRS